MGATDRLGMVSCLESLMCHEQPSGQEMLRVIIIYYTHILLGHNNPKVGIEIAFCAGL